MTKQKSLIGTELDCSIRTVESSQLYRLNQVFYQPNASGKDHDKPSYQHLPPFLMGNLINLAKIYKILNVSINSILLSRESVISHKLLKAGDSIKVKTYLKDAYEQQASSNPIGFIILESIGFKESEVYFYCERVFAVRGGFQRGRS